MNFFSLDDLPDVRLSDLDLLKQLLKKVESLENELA